ncbi:MAG: YncE family protein, partial [Candidatus Micrarchaeia archaeon]
MRKTLFVQVFIIVMLAVLGVVNATTLTASPNPFTFSNSIIDVGQISVANTVISGGIGPYSGSYSFVNNHVFNTIKVGSEPYGVAFNPSGTLAYVTNYGSDTVSVIDVSTNTIVNTITVGSEPTGVAFNPSGTLAYVTNYGSNTVSVID